MRNFLNSLLTAFAILLFIPSTLILVSWNALPGDSLYSLKTGLEDVALALTIRTPIAQAFSLKFTDRRFSEANRLLAKNGSTLGYSLLVTEAKETKQIIIDKSDTKSATQLVAQIKEYQVAIEEKKLALATRPASVLPPQVEPAPTAHVSTPAPTSQPAAPAPVAPAAEPPASTPPPVTDVDEVIDDLDETQDELDEIIDELEHELPPQASQKAQEVQELKETQQDNLVTETPQPATPTPAPPTPSGTESGNIN